MCIRDRYREHRWPAFADLEAENTAALRELLAVAIEARKANARVHDAWRALRDAEPTVARMMDGDR